MDAFGQSTAMNKPYPISCTIDYSPRDLCGSSLSEMEFRPQLEEYVHRQQRLAWVWVLMTFDLHHRIIFLTQTGNL